MTLEERIELLELSAGMGTILQRIVTDKMFCQKHGVTLSFYAVPEQTIWCLALGRPLEPKTFFYGLTIREAVSNAEKGIRK